MFSPEENDRCSVVRVYMPLVANDTPKIMAINREHRNRFDSRFGHDSLQCLLKTKPTSYYQKKKGQAQIGLFFYVYYLPLQTQRSRRGLKGDF